MKKREISIKQIVRTTLQGKTLLMLAIIMFFFMIIFFISTSIIRRKEENNYRVNASVTAVNNVSSGVNASLKNYNAITRLIMIDEKVLDYLRCEDTDINKTYRATDARMGVREILNVSSNIDSVYIIRNDGEYVTTGHGVYSLDTEADVLSKVWNARGATVVSINGDGTIRKDNASPFLTISRAIYDINSQRLLGMLMMNITNEATESLLSIQNVDGMCIVDSNGNFLCGKEEVALLYSDEFLCETAEHREIIKDGNSITVTGKIITDPLIALCISGKSEGGLSRDTLYALIMTLAALIISVFAYGIFFTINIDRPIKNLNTAMEKTKSSGWLVKIDTAMPNNEIGRLTESYNSMIEYLNELFNRLIEKEKNIQKAEMRVLQEQIKPHFLYNSLETISYMAVQEKAGQVHDALELLGNFYRNFLSKGSNTIPLKRELRITKDYLALQKLRYGDIFEDEYIIDERTVDCTVPKLLLQPLVENCIYHGVRLKGEKGIIRITTVYEEKGIRMKVFDTGVGMSEEQINEVLRSDFSDNKEQLMGFGLRGTVNRIRYYCGFEDVVNIRSELGEYTEIDILIPNIWNESNEKEEG